MMTIHTKFQTLATAVQRLTNEFRIMRGVHQSAIESIQQESLTALLLSDNPIKLTANLIQLKYKRRLNSVSQLQEHLKSFREAMLLEQVTEMVQAPEHREAQQPNIVPSV